MSERDALARDLKEALKDDLATGGGNRWPNEHFLAVRLIALGWTRLDEERLARALVAVIGKEARDASDVGLRPAGGRELEAWNYVARHFEAFAKSKQTAHAIAAAYREANDA